MIEIAELLAIIQAAWPSSMAFDTHVKWLDTRRERRQYQHQRRIRVRRVRMNGRVFRMGQIVPSSNTTMETELPAIFRARERWYPGEQFSFHSSRMRMKRVTRDELAAMDGDSGRCALELSDARVDVIGYACLVAIMSMGAGYHRVAQQRLHSCTVANTSAAPVVTSAGALIDGLAAIGARKVAVITPYMKPLTQLVTDYIEAEGFEVRARVSLEIEDNVAVGRRDPLALVEIARGMDLSDVDVLVLSACVQMPSLAAIPVLEAICGKPVVSAAVCTAYAMLQALNLAPAAPDAGALLSGRYAPPPVLLGVA